MVASLKKKEVEIYKDYQVVFLGLTCSIHATAYQKVSYVCCNYTENGHTSVWTSNNSCFRWKFNLRLSMICSRCSDIMIVCRKPRQSYEVCSCMTNMSDKNGDHGAMYTQSPSNLVKFTVSQIERNVCTQLVPHWYWCFFFMMLYEGRDSFVLFEYSIVRERTDGHPRNMLSPYDCP